MQTIPTFIINLKKRKERREHIVNQFKNQHNFQINIVDAIEHKIGAIGLWETIKIILYQQSASPHDYILICEDDHKFTDNYSLQALSDAILLADRMEADVLSGGVSWFTNALPVNDNFFWVEKFSGLQFTIVFKRFYDTILNADFTEKDEADYKISSLSKRKFFIYPFISIQKEFGYSDVTDRNSADGRVDQLFKESDQKVKKAQYVSTHYQNESNEVHVNIDTREYENLKIPTYIINLENRVDRKEHILSQFESRNEFELNLFNAIKHDNGALGLWLSIKCIIKAAQKKNEDLIILCTDDHQFTKHYSKEVLIRNIMESYYQKAEILSGGVGDFGLGIPINERRFWIDAYNCTPFTVLYKRIFQKILDQELPDGASSDWLLSRLALYKMAIFPFISVEKKFGYPDTLGSGIKEPLKSFEKAEERFSMASYANKTLINSTSSVKG
jgi:GR25 family glycosyltransferase involved in LPS biosynthesis